MQHNGYFTFRGSRLFDALFYFRKQLNNAGTKQILRYFRYLTDDISISITYDEKSVSYMFSYTLSFVFNVHMMPQLKNIFLDHFIEEIRQHFEKAGENQIKRTSSS